MRFPPVLIAVTAAILMCAAGRANTSACLTCHGNVKAFNGSSSRLLIDSSAMSRSAHGKMPCQSCHRRFTGYPHKPEWSVARAKCGDCHAGSVKSYSDSFHGKAHSLGLAGSPVCDDCHTVHAMRPSNDPSSSIAPQNVNKMCRTCHRGFGGKSAAGSVHVGSDIGGTGVVRLVRLVFRAFMWTIALVFMFLVTLDIGRRVMDRIRRASKGKRESEPVVGHHQRFTTGLRIQHGILMLSFFLLSITGLPLLFPVSPVSKLVVELMGGMAARGLLHRIGAVLLLGLAVFHATWLIVTDRGRWESACIRLSWTDICDAFNHIAYYFNRSDKPRYGRYSWMQKLEYAGVVWGTIITGTSGLVLWFHVRAAAVFPSWIIDIASIIHSYEARLAMLSIIIWHLYHTVISPDVFPMDMSWITGRLSLKRMREEHPAEYEKAFPDTESAE